MVISEDSDMLVFGATNIVFKFGAEYTGKEIKLADLFKTTDIDLKGWTHDRFIQCCILAGCDYLKNPRMIAFKTAHDLFEKFNSVQQVMTYLMKKEKNNVDEEYVNQYEQAYLTFKYQRVWCPIKKCVVSLNNFRLGDEEEVKKEIGRIKLSTDLSKMSSLSSELLEREMLLKHFKKSNLNFLGPAIEPDTAADIVHGKINPQTHKDFQENLEFMFDPRELTPKEIHGLGFKKISESLYLDHFPREKKNAGEPMLVNLCMEFDEGAIYDQESRTKRLNEESQNDPQQALLRLLVSPGPKKAASPSPPKPVGGTQRSAKKRPARSNDTEDSGDEDVSCVLDFPNDIDLNMNAHLPTNKSSVYRRKSSPGQNLRTIATKFRQDSRKSILVEEKANLRKKFLADKSNTSHGKGLFSNLCGEDDRQ